MGRFYPVQLGYTHNIWCFRRLWEDFTQYSWDIHTIFGVSGDCGKISDREVGIYTQYLVFQASVERFDPRIGRWSPVPSMSSRRSSCGVAPLDGALYCVGGNDGTMCMSSGERFNVRRNAWEPIPSMHSRRSTHEVVEIEGCLYALGGNDGSSSLNSVERYDPKQNKWTLVTSMLTRRSSVGAAVLECLNLEKGIQAAKNI